MNEFTQEEKAKLPKWALQKIEMLEAERRTAVDALRQYTDEQTESPFRVTELECIGEQVGPTFLTRYIQAYKAFGPEVYTVLWYDGIWCVEDNKNEPYPFRGYRDNDGPYAPRGWMPLPEPPQEASE